MTNKKTVNPYANGKVTQVHTYTPNVLKHLTVGG